MLSKAKFNKIEEVLVRSLEDEAKAQEVLAAIAEAIGYDPQRNTYDRQRYQANKEAASEATKRYLQKKADRGEPVRPPDYYKQWYQSHRDAVLQQQRERRQRLKAAAAI